MHALKITSGALALLALVLGLAYAQTKPAPEVKGEPGALSGAIIRMFKDEKLIELKVEKIILPEKRGEEREKSIGPREGEVIYTHVADCKVLDEKGTELKRDDKSAWFSRDAGWAALKEGRRVKVEYSGTHELPPPRDFPKEARTGGNLLVYHATLVQILPEESKP
jgi:hypothetical protein